MIGAGLLDQRVRLEAPGTARGADGAVVDAWTPVATVWAHVQDASGREYLAAAATQNSAYTQIRIRYRRGVEPKMRAIHGAVIYHIEAVLGQDRQDLMLMCRRAD